MQVWEIILLSVALAMDACAVGMTDGMTESKMKLPKVLLIGAFFGFFQFLMPLIGYYITGVIAGAFLDTFEAVSAWISFALLAFLGGKMLWESIAELREKRKLAQSCACGELVSTGAAEISAPSKEEKQTLTVGKLCLQALATSIDALAVGVTLQMAAISEAGLALGAWGATGVIGVITFALSVAAVYIGKLIGDKLSDKAGIFGGAVLLAIGLKILIEGLI